MAKQYGTYIGAPSIDWGKAIGGISKALEDIGLERKNQILEADRLTQEAQKSIASIEGIKTQSLQEYITTGAGQGRALLAKYNKQLKDGIITQQQFTSIKNNMLTDWSTMGNTMKNFDATNQALLTRQNEGKASDLETYLAGKHASLADLRNRFYTFSGDGHGYMVQKNDDGTVALAPSISLADPMNLMDEKIDFDKLISLDTKTIGDYVTQTSYSAQGSTKINNPLANANVQEMVNNLINKYTNNPRGAAQVLTTYGEDYDFYETQEEKNQLIQNYRVEIKQEDPSLTDEQIDAGAKDYERQLIRVTLTDNNKYEPVLSQEQNEEARKIIKSQVEGRIDFSETKSRPVTPRQPRSAKAKSISQAAKSAGTYVTKLDEILNKKANSTDLQTLNDIFGKDGNREIRIDGGKYVVYKFNPTKYKKYDPDTKQPVLKSGQGVWEVEQDVSRLATWKNLLNFNTPGYSSYWDEAVNNLEK
jgi:hypothetical protein